MKTWEPPEWFPTARNGPLAAHEDSVAIHPDGFLDLPGRESLLFLPQHLQTSARVQQQISVWVEGWWHTAMPQGRGDHSPWYAAPWGQRGSPCLQPPHNGSSQPTSCSLGGGTRSGPDTDLCSPDTFTGHQRPCLSQDFWQYGCTLHSCTITAQIRDDVHFCELQRWGKNNLNSGYFTSCLGVVSSHVNSPREFMVGRLGRYSWFLVC